MRSFEAGFEQKFSLGLLVHRDILQRAVSRPDRFQFLTGTEFPAPSPFTGQYENIDKSIAHGAEIELHGRPLSRVSIDGAYNYTSTQILEQPFAFDNLHQPGQPLIEAAETFRKPAADLFGKTMGRQPGRKFCGPAPGFRLSGIQYRSCGRICTRRFRRLVCGNEANHGLRKRGECFG